MRHLRILLKKSDKNETVVKFDEPLVVEDETMTVKCASVFWDYDNILVPIYVSHGTKKIKFIPGYWTVSMIIEKLQATKTNIKLLLNSCKIRIQPSEDLSLHGLSPLLGFDDKKKVILKGTVSISESPVAINLGLRFVTIKCNIVDKSKTSLQGQRDNTIVSLPITTLQSLKGSVTHFENINCKTELNNGIYNELKFTTSHNVGDVLLDLVIK